MQGNMWNARPGRVLKIAGVVLAAWVTVWGAGVIAREPDEPATSGGPATFRRLNEVQYKRSIDDIFGAGIKIPGRFEPPLRDEGLLAIGSSKATLTPSGFEQDELRAREISGQVLAEDRRKTVMPCQPQTSNAFDESCASQFIAKYGRLLFRRPLSDTETTSIMTVAQTAADKSGDFYKGLQSGLARLLVSPEFLFRVERTEPNPEGSATQRLDDYSLAARISFLLWDAPPDEALLDAAANGELRQQDGVRRQVDRMIASPRFEQGVRAFFADMFAYDEFDGLAKDQSLFPKYTSQLARDAQEQSLRTIVDLLVTRKGDYRDLFTTKNTFLNRNLGSLYKVPVDNAAFDGWMPYTFKSEDNHAGILTLAAFLMLDPEHEGKTSPTIRGKNIRELFLCQKVPQPPGNVDFSKFNDPKNPNATVRERLTAHRDNPTCAGCHSIMDPIGLAMENYDALGTYRTRERGVPIDASGTLEGKTFKDLIGLEKVLHDSSTVTSCVAERAYEYGVGRTVAASERDWLKYTDQRFAEDHYQFPALMRRIATSKAFRTISANTLASN
jgi:hypothetical protein